VVGVTGGVEEYLRELRASLRTPPEKTSRILAEAEDHLRESVAAGLAAGMTQAEAAEAAVSSFGSVRAVVRAHETGRDRAAAALGDVTLPVMRLAGIFLLASFAILVVLLVLVAFRQPDAGTAHAGAADRPSAALDWWPDTGPAGLVVLGGYYLVRRFARRRGGRPRRMRLGGHALTVGAAGFAVATMTLMLLNSVGVTFPGEATAAFGSLGMAVIYTVRTVAGRRDPAAAGSVEGISSEDR
jgi:hypothetical protein